MDDALERLSYVFIGPGSLARLWRLLFGMRFVRSRDRVLVFAVTIHIVTTVAISVALGSLLAHDVFGM